MAVNNSEIWDWTIYRITNPKGRVYIGKTGNYKARVRQYKCIQLKDQNLITRSLVKYGFDAHKFDIIDTFTGTGNYCSGKEMFWIRTYMSNMCKYPEQNGMNLTDGGEGVLGIKRSDEFKEAARQRRLGKPNSEYQKEVARKLFIGNTYRLGKKQSASEIEKRASKIRGRKMGYEELIMRNKMNTELRGKKVTVFDSVTNTYNDFDSLELASKYTGIHSQTISYRLRGIVNSIPIPKNRRYTFKYK
jgi:group I intron endonuclease